MTSQPAPQESVEAPVPPTSSAPHSVTPRKGSRLDQLHAIYLDLHAQKADIESQFRAVTDAIKVELNTLDPAQRRFELAGRDGRRPLQLVYSETRRFDSTRFKKEQPETYLAFLKEPAGSWTLQPAKGGAE